jgi:hypothetical protein
MTPKRVIGSRASSALSVLAVLAEQLIQEAPARGVG